MKKDLSKFVPVFTVENWDEVETLFRGCGPAVFRGQSDSSWELTTNYERKFKTNVGRESSMIKTISFSPVAVFSLTEWIFSDTFCSPCIVSSFPYALLTFIYNEEEKL